MNELIKNASGVNDITAYRAITNAEGQDGCPASPGEIWEQQQSNGMVRTFLVLAPHGTYATGLMLLDSTHCPHRYEVRFDNAVMVTDCGRLSNASSSALEKFVARIPFEDFREIMRRVHDLLGCVPENAGEGTEVAQEAQTDRDDKSDPDLQQKASEGQEMLNMAIRDNKSIQLDLRRLEKECEMYRQLYEEAKEQLLDVAV